MLQSLEARNTIEHLLQENSTLKTEIKSMNNIQFIKAKEAENKQNQIN